MTARWCAACNDRHKRSTWSGAMWLGSVVAIVVLLAVMGR